MSETKAPYKVERRGGVRIPGPGKSIGRPREVIDPITVSVYLDRPTKTVLDTISTNQSEAIRKMAEFWEKHH
jgi:hypothetical protein